MSKYWVNSNTGDWICKDEDKITICLLGRSTKNYYLPIEYFEITEAQFNSLRGFIPIKEKKLFSRSRYNNYRATYGYTDSNGDKYIGDRVEVPTLSELRDIRLKEMGL